AAFYFIGCRFWELGAGAILFITTYRPDSMKNSKADDRFLSKITAWLGTLCLGVSFLYSDGSKFPWPWALVPVIGTCLLIHGWSKLKPNDIIRRILASTPCVWVGKRSYSLYLWHWPVFVLMRWTIGLNTFYLYTAALLTTIILSMFSYSCIEQPLRRGIWIQRQPQWLRIIGFALLPAIGFYIVNFIFDNNHRFGLSVVSRSRSDWMPENYMPYPEAGHRRCQVKIEVGTVAGGSEISFTPTECSIKQSPKNMFVLGDSHARAISPMLEQLSAESGLNIKLNDFTGCSYMSLIIPMEDPQNSDCLLYSQEITKHLIAASKHGDIVLLPSLRLNRYVEQDSHTGILDMHEFMYAPHIVQLRHESLAEAKRWLRTFSDNKLEVVFYAPTPIFKSPPIRCSDWFNSMNPICIGGLQLSRSEIEDSRKPILDSMIELTQAYPNVRIFDAFPVLCPNEVCDTSRNGRPLFVDGDHVSAYGNLVIYPNFRQYFQELIGKE
ncbi:MAG: acyltransferase, partial [Bdellovibrionales bacterium]|nr:acyltransferase [Bdellovibrionales bacterium]